MKFLSTADYGIFLAYFAVLIGIGLYLRQRASAELESYFLADKKLRWWMLGVTDMGGSLDVTGTIGSLKILSFHYAIV